MIKRHSGNSEADLFYVKFFEGGTNDDIAAEYWWSRSAGSTYAYPDEWVELVVDLNNLIYDGTATLGYTNLSQITAVEQIMFGVLQQTAPGTGTIDIDDILLRGIPRCDITLEGDLNGDCIVNLYDFVILAENWLLGVQ